MKETLQQMADLAIAEATASNTKFGEYNSLHEAWAVLFEEVDELKDEMRKKQIEEPIEFYHPEMRSPTAIKKEAIQIAAVALRIAQDAERMAMK